MLVELHYPVMGYSVHVASKLLVGSHTQTLIHFTSIFPLFLHTRLGFSLIIWNVFDGMWIDIGVDYIVLQN